MLEFEDIPKTNENGEQKINEKTENLHKKRIVSLEVLYILSYVL